MEAPEPNNAAQPADQNDAASPASAHAPTKRLPSTRIAFAKQLDELRALAAASGPDRNPITAAQIGELVGLAGSTVQLTIPFFVDVGLAERTGSGLIPPEAVVSFQQAHQWEAEHPARELAPLLAETWFAKSLTPKLSFGEISEKEALAILAREARANPPSHRAALMVLLDYLEAAEIIAREGGMVRRSPARLAQPEQREMAPDPLDQSSLASEPPVRPSSEQTVASHPLIRGLFQELPPPGTVWSKDKHDAWLELARVAFRIVYSIKPESTEIGRHQD